MRRRLVPLALVSLVGLGAAIGACAAETDDPQLNPQPLPPGDEKNGGEETRAPEANAGDQASSSSGSGGTATPPASDAGADGGDGG